MKRIFLEIMLFLVIILAPWWVSVLLALVLLFYFKSFNEIVIYGMVIDILYGQIYDSAKGLISLTNYKFTLLFLLFLFSSFIIKKHLKFYSDK